MSGLNDFEMSQSEMDDGGLYICSKDGCKEVAAQDSRYCWEHENRGLDDPNSCDECGSDLDADGFCWECDF